MAGEESGPSEVSAGMSLARRLVASQFPQWRGLSLQAVPSEGTDNALFRLGRDMVLRLPRSALAALQLEKEQRWLPVIGPLLPLAVPIPLAEGRPEQGYSWKWSVYGWLEGRNATLEQISDRHQVATDLSRFIRALWRIDTVGGPPPGEHNFQRGTALQSRDAATRAAIATLDGEIDTSAAIGVWEAALQAPAWQAAPVWGHGDLHAGNLLFVDGRLSAVIDFGGLAVGDPAVDVMAAWLYFDVETRRTFRARLEVDDATWTRGRGWALSVGVVALPYHRRSNPVLAGMARRAIEEATREFRQLNRGGVGF